MKITNVFFLSEFVFTQNMKSKIITIGLIVLISCKNSGIQNPNTDIAKDTMHTSVTHESEKLLEEKQENRVRISRIEKLSILNIEKFIDTASPFYSNYSSKCEKWNLKNDEIIDILINSKMIDGQEFHYYFDILPSSYKGEVIINDSINAKIEINSGSSTVLILPDTSYLLGYYGEKNYFILKPGIK